MLMPQAFLFVMLLAMPTYAQTGTGDPSARLAALSFAKENGFEFPTDSIVVANESVVGRGPTPVSRISEQSSAAASRALAAQISANARAAAAVDFLECKQTVCSPSGRMNVLVVSEPAESPEGVQVGIRLFSPGSQAEGFRPSITNAVIKIERRGTGWVGTGIDLGPTKAYIRR